MDGINYENGRNGDISSWGYESSSVLVVACDIAMAEEFNLTKIYNHTKY